MANTQDNTAWEWQIRINLTEEFAEAVRLGQDIEAVQPLIKMLAEKYDAVLMNQFDAFAGYCTAAEETGQTDTTLYRWTKDLVDNPAKKAQYATRFTIYADGEKETYGKDIADKIEADLAAFVDSGVITKINKIDTNPANNPQAPRRFH
jgi:hypothetical protein